MGYDLARFIGEIDDEFQCSICTMVLEDAVQTPCEHTFCNECLKQWVSINESCPTDRTPLTIAEIKPPSRLLRNLWSKLDIKCDFQPQGCSAIIKLENLRSHVSSCEYSLNSEIVCGRCNMTITRLEYKLHNCFTHLTNRVSAQEKEIIELRREVASVHEQKRLKLIGQKEYFERIVYGLQEENRKLNDELSRQRSKVDHLQNSLSHQQQQTAELSFESNISLRPLKWLVCDNMKIEQSNILKVDNPLMLGIVQSEYPLEPTKSNFKVRVLNIEHKSGIYDTIGVGRPFADISYYSNGNIWVYGRKMHDGPKWRVNDIIECGIKFPNNFINGENHSATVYFSRNENIIYEESIIPKDGLFPKVRLSGKDIKLQYLQ